MARPLRVTYPGAFYHVTSRGNEQKKKLKGSRLHISLSEICRRDPYFSPKVRERKAGYVLFPIGRLYEKCALYKVPTTAGWTKAHAL